MAEVGSLAHGAVQPWPALMAWLTLRTTGSEPSSDITAVGPAIPEQSAAGEKASMPDRCLLAVHG
ncbi:hypothetical protein [Streptomyces sp. NBC_00057]|uniref:hypothetical protein n=1 Tax=Streptomyces sp. NBC_00057 TaxID=2975634 RepID=UPI002F911DA0